MSSFALLLSLCFYALTINFTFGLITDLPGLIINDMRPDSVKPGRRRLIRRILYVLILLILAGIAVTDFGRYRREKLELESIRSTLSREIEEAAPLSEALSGSYEESEIFRMLRALGYSPAGICAILGNIAVECPDFNADTYGNNGYTYGLFQWNNDGDRMNSLVSWCNSRILYPNRIEGQIYYAVHELEGADPIAARLNDYLKTTEDAAEAAAEFAVGFERCVGESGHETDGIYTGTLYPECYGKTYQDLELRIRKAAEYMQQYQTVSGKYTRTIAVEMNTLSLRHRDSDAHMHLHRLLYLILGYLFGCIFPADIIARLAKGRSIFRLGNGRPDTMNVLKSVGMREALLTFAGDILKTVAAIGLAYLLSHDRALDEYLIWTGVGVVFGHYFPILHKLHGGRGVTVIAALLILYMPLWGSLCCAAAFGFALLTKQDALGAILLTALAIPFGFVFKDARGGCFVLLLCLLVVLKQGRHILSQPKTGPRPAPEA